MSPYQSVACVLSKKEHFELLGLIAKKDINDCKELTSDTIISKLSVNKKQFKSRILALMSNALIIAINDEYHLTQFGKEVYNTLRIIEEAIAIRMKLKAVDLINQSENTTTEEFDQILNILIKNGEVRKIVKQINPNQYVRIRSKRNRSLHY